MFKKTCDYCGQDSYSSVAKGEWICPYCNKELTAGKAEPANAGDESKGFETPENGDKQKRRD